MTKSAIWKIRPLKNEIILTLIKSKGEMLDVDLLRNLQMQFPELSRNELNRELFKLEVQMIIDVQKIRKNASKVALLPNAPISEDLLKDLQESIHT